ncbi:MAG: protein kinase domain-containing protein [Aggregatilineales bacterium]
MRRDVAVRVLPPQFASQAGYTERFMREAQTAASLEHAHIVPVYDFGLHGGIYYVVMRLLTGGSLAERLQFAEQGEQPLPSLVETAEVVGRIAAALDYAHSRGVIHRDIKASNVMFDDQGNPFLVDFGIAKLLGATSSLTGTGVAMGTPSYMSPEQWRGEGVTPETDQYALGVMTYTMLTGRMPFEAPTPYALMHKHLTEQPTPPSVWRADLPETVRPVLERAMAKAPADRYPSARAFAEALAAAASAVPAADPTHFFAVTLPKSGLTPPAAPSPAEARPTAPPPGAARSRADYAPTTPGVSGAQPAAAQTPSPFAAPPVRPNVPVVLLMAASVVLIGLAALGVVGLRPGGFLAGLIASAAPTATPNQTATHAHAQLIEIATNQAAGLNAATSTFTTTTTPTSTLTSTPTATPSATPTSTPATPVAQALGDVAIRLGPGADYPQIGTLALGDRLNIVGISDDGVWYQVILPDGSRGWIVSSEALVQASGDLARLAVAQPPTLTPTNTPTATPTDTPTSTDTPAVTPTATPSSTPSLTATPTPTPPPSATPTRTLAPPTLIPTSLPLTHCPGALPSRLIPGQRGIVRDDDPSPVNVRSGPGINFPRIGQIAIRSVFDVVEGPVCANNMAWYKIIYSERFEGWIAEGDISYFVDPLLDGGQPLSTLPTPLPLSTSAPLVQTDRVLAPTCDLILEDEFAGGRSPRDWFQSAAPNDRSTVQLVDGAYAIHLRSVQSRNEATSWGKPARLRVPQRARGGCHQRQPLDRQPVRDWPVAALSERKQLRGFHDLQ